MQENSETPTFGAVRAVKWDGEVHGQYLADPRHNADVCVLQEPGGGHETRRWSSAGIARCHFHERGERRPAQRAASLGPGRGGQPRTCHACSSALLAAAAL